MTSPLTRIRQWAEAKKKLESIDYRIPKRAKNGWTENTVYIARIMEAPIPLTIPKSANDTTRTEHPKRWWTLLSITSRGVVSMACTLYRCSCRVKESLAYHDEKSKHGKKCCNHQENSDSNFDSDF